jgi:nucleosome binding factor SPN SPT16 subunit
MPIFIKLQEDGDNWGGASAIIVPAGSASEGFRYSKTSSLYLWLLGYEFTGE